MRVDRYLPMLSLRYLRINSMATKLATVEQWIGINDTACGLATLMRVDRYALLSRHQLKDRCVEDEQRFILIEGKCIVYLPWLFSWIKLRKLYNIDPPLAFHPKKNPLWIRAAWIRVKLRKIYICIRQYHKFYYYTVNTDAKCQCQP